MTRAQTCELTCGTTETKLVCFLFSTSLSAQSCALHRSSYHGNDSAELKPGVLLSCVTIGFLREDQKESGRGMCCLAVCLISTTTTPLHLYYQTYIFLDQQFFLIVLLDQLFLKVLVKSVLLGYWFCLCVGSRQCSFFFFFIAPVCLYFPIREHSRVKCFISRMTTVKVLRQNL